MHASGGSVCRLIGTLREDARFGGSVCGAYETPKGVDKPLLSNLDFVKQDRVGASSQYEFVPFGVLPACVTAFNMQRKKASFGGLDRAT
jgi:hypothetical protein